MPSSGPERMTMITDALSLPIDEYKQLLALFAQALWETDAHGKVVIDLPSWRAYTGQSLQEWLGEGWAGAVHPDDQPYARHQWQQAVGRQSPVNAEFRLRSPDGGWRWTNVRATCIQDTNGRVKKWVGLNIDIDDKKKAEHALQHQQTRLEEAVSQRTAELLASQQRHQATLDSTQELIQVFEAVRDESGQIIDFIWQLNNRAAEQYYGDVIGQRLLTHNPGVAETGIFATFKRVVETGIADQSERHYVHEQFNGWFYQSTVKLNDGVATTTTNITPLKQAEAETRNGYALLQSVIDSSLDIIQVFKALRNDQGQIIDFIWIVNNQRAIEQNGDVIGKSLLKQSPGVVETAIFDQMVEVTQTGVAYEHERYYAHEQFEDWFYQAIVKTDDGVAMTTRNITPQKQAEQQILRLKDERARQATDKYQALFESVDQGVSIIELIFDDNGHVMDHWQREHNPAFSRMTGLTDAIRKGMSEQVPDGKLGWHQLLEQIYYRGEPIRLEYPVGPLGQWFTAYMARVGGEGSPLISCIYDDITERKQREQQQAFLLALADTLRPLADRQGIENTSLRMLSEFLGIDRSYIIATASDEGHDRAVIRAEYNPGGLVSIVGDDQVADLSQGIIPIDQQTRIIETTLTDSLLSDDAKASFATSSLAALISTSPRQGDSLVSWSLVAAHSEPRKWLKQEVELVETVAQRTWTAVQKVKAEDALHHSEERFRLLVTASSDSLYRMSADWSQMLNLKGMNFLTDTDQTSDHWLTRYIPADDQPAVQQAIQQAIQTKQLFEQEHRVIQADGSVSWTLSRAIPVLDEQGQIDYWFGAASDITPRKRMEHQLRLADQRKDEFLAMLAHELRNPMATIRSGLQILSLTTETDTVAASTVAMMNRQTDHLVRMVDDLLDVSRISQGKIELHSDRLDLVALVRQATESVRGLFEEQGRRLLVDLPNAPIYVAGDATRLSQVVTNLLTNGVRYTAEAGQVGLRLTHKGREAILEVRDNGIGLAADHLSAIFELFVQVDDSTARSKSGLGLGLTLVKRLVELHGGRVEAQSAGLGQGSTFRVQLPALTSAPTSPAQRPALATDSATAQRILVIDDNADAALMMTMLLKLKGYEAHSRTSGRAGLEAADVLQPRAILLDIGMPDLDGYATCELLRAQTWGKDIVVIALTGYGQGEDRQRTQQAGFDAHLVKPVDVEALTELLTNLLAKRAL